MFRSKRRKKWEKLKETTQVIVAYLYCPSCQYGMNAYEKKMLKAKSCEECYTKGVILLRPYNICYECKYAFPEIDYKFDWSSSTHRVCPNCGHAEYYFRNISIYLPDFRKALKPERWQNEVKKYPCSLNEEFIKKKKKPRKKAKGG